MGGAASRISSAHADTADLEPAGDDWAVVAGVPCQHIALPFPWATSGRILALPGPPERSVVAEVAAWLGARSPLWSLLVRAQDERAFDGFRRRGLAFQRWDSMPVLALDGPPRPQRSSSRAQPRHVVDIGPARDREEFLAAYGAELAPLVTPAHLAADRMHHLVARVDGEPVGCVRIREMGDTAYLGALTVLPGWQGRGLGTALMLAASELAGSLSDLVWLHCTDSSRALYERLGYRHVDDHAVLVPSTPR